MKVLFISTMPDNWWGGSEELWVVVAEEAVVQGHQLLISFPNERNQLHQNFQGLEEQDQVSWHYRRKPGSSFWQRVQQKLERWNTPHSNIPNEWFKTLQTVEQFQPDFIYINQGWVTTVVEDPQLYWLAQTYRKAPYFILSQQNAEHFVYHLPLLEQWRKLIPQVRCWYFISERNRKVAQRQLALPEFTNWAEAKNPCKTILAEPISFPENTIATYAFVGRLECMHKGLDILIEALSTEIWKERNWKLNLYGSGKDKAYLIDLIKYYNLENKIEFKGYIGEISEIWEENQMMILPSVKEGTPLALMEAMQHGRAAIATDVGDSGRLVIDGETGFLVEALTPKLLGEALERSWQAREEWEQLGENAFEYSKKYIDSTAGKTLLEDMLKRI